MRTKDFLTAFRPLDGDLIYGRAEARGAYFDLLNAGQVEACEKFGAWVTIDSFNDFFGTSGAAFDSGPHRGAIRRHVEDRDVFETVLQNLSWADTADLGVRQQDQREAYQKKVMMSRYAPTQVLDPTRTPSHKLDKEGFAAGTPVTPTADDAQFSNRTYKSIRRACKFGIGMVATEAAFRTPRAKIRFVLDGLDMEAIARKQERQGYDRFAVPITSSELRYVFKNWSKLEKFVKFYVNLSAVNPPWQEDWDLESVAAVGIPARTKACKAAWDAYGNVRDLKYAGVPPTKGLV